MTLQFEEVLSDRFRMVFSIRMAQDLWGFMGISWIYPQMNGWCSSWRDWGLLNFDTNPSSLFRKPWVFFKGGSTRSLIDFWLDCSTSIDSMGYSYIYIYSIYIHWICVLVAFGCIFRIYSRWGNSMGYSLDQCVGCHAGASPNFCWGNQRAVSHFLIDYPCWILKMVHIFSRLTL